MPAGFVRERRPYHRMIAVGRGQADNADIGSDQVGDGVGRKRIGPARAGVVEGCQRRQPLHGPQAETCTLVVCQERPEEMRDDDVETAELRSDRASDLEFVDGTKQGFGRVSAASRRRRGEQAFHIVVQRAHIGALVSPGQDCLTLGDRIRESRDRWVIAPGHVDFAFAQKIELSERRSELHDAFGVERHCFYVSARRGIWGVFSRVHAKCLPVIKVMTAPLSNRAQSL